MRLAVMGIDLDYCVLAACTTDLMHGPTKSAMMVYADCITEGVGEGGGGGVCHGGYRQPPSCTLHCLACG